MKNKQILSTILIASALMFSSNMAQAQLLGQGAMPPPPADVPIPFPEVPYDSQVMAAANCDQPTYMIQYNRQKAEYYAKIGAIDKVVVKSQANAVPKAAVNAAMSCVQGAMNQIKGIANTVDGILAMISGAGSVDWGALGGQVLSKVGDMACSQINNYTSGALYTATQPFTSQINSTLGAANNVGIATPLGNVNVGNSVLTATKAAGTTPGVTGVAAGAVGSATGVLNGAANTVQSKVTTLIK